MNAITAQQIAELLERIRIQSLEVNMILVEVESGRILSPLELQGLHETHKAIVSARQLWDSLHARLAKHNAMAAQAPNN